MSLVNSARYIDVTEKAHLSNRFLKFNVKVIKQVSLFMKNLFVEFERSLRTWNGIL